MNSIYRSLLSVVVCFLVNPLHAADDAKDAAKKDDAKKEAKPAAKAEKDSKKNVEQVRIYVEGAYCAGCAEVLGESLTLIGVKNTSKIAVNGGKGYVIVLADFKHDADLSKLADAVNGANTPHKKLAKPGVSLELFAKLDKDSAAKAMATLGKLDGVDAKGSFANIDLGVLGIRLTGGEKPQSATKIIEALKKDGIEARIVTDSAVRLILETPKDQAPVEEKKKAK